MTASSTRARPANRDSPASRDSQRASRSGPGHSAVVAIAPALTIGFVRPAGSRSTAYAELNARPVAFTPTRRRTSATPTASPMSAKTNGFETLITVNGVCASPATARSPVTETTASPKASGSASASAG